MKILTRTLAALGILSGILIVGQAIFTLYSGGYVVLPSRFRDDINITPEDGGVVFSVLLAIYFGGGIWFIWLGWRLLKEKFS